MDSIKEQMEQIRNCANFPTIDMLMDVANQLRDPEAHTVRRAVVVMQCDDCGEIAVWAGQKESQHGSYTPMLGTAALRLAQSKKEQSHGNGKNLQQDQRAGVGQNHRLRRATTRRPR